MNLLFYPILIGELGRTTGMLSKFELNWSMDSRVMVREIRYENTKMAA